MMVHCDFNVHIQHVLLAKFTKHRFIKLNRNGLLSNVQTLFLFITFSYLSQLIPFFDPIPNLLLTYLKVRGCQMFAFFVTAAVIHDFCLKLSHVGSPIHCSIMLV